MNVILEVSGAKSINEIKTCLTTLQFKTCGWESLFKKFIKNNLGRNTCNNKNIRIWRNYNKKNTNRKMGKGFEQQFSEEIKHIKIGRNALLYNH